MKKTLIALMALAGVAMAKPATFFAPEDYGYVAYQTDAALSLSSSTTINASSFDFPYGNVNTENGLFIAKDGGDTSPGFAKVVLTLNLTNLDATGNIMTVMTDNSANQSGWGLYLGAEGALTFGQANWNGGNPNIHTAKADCGTLTADTEYTITLVSKGTGSVVGRGTENFTITVAAEGIEAATYTADGFGLNGNYFSKMMVGSANGVNGTVGIVAYVPEPATATLSLLALAGLAARRRRK